MGIGAILQNPLRRSRIYIAVGICIAVVLTIIAWQVSCKLFIEYTMGMRAEQVSVQADISQDLSGSIVTGIVTFRRIGWIKAISVFLYDKDKSLLGWKTLDFPEPNSYNPPESLNNDKWPINEQFFVVTNNSFMTRIPIAYANHEKVSTVKYETVWWVRPTVAGTAAIFPTITASRSQTVVVPKEAVYIKPEAVAPLVKRPPKEPVLATPPRLVCYYPFNGNAQDESNNMLHGKIRGATLTMDRFGKHDSAYHFNGKNSYIEILNTEHLNPKVGLTVIAWVRLTEPLRQRENVVVSKFLSGRRRCYSLYINEKEIPIAYIAGIRMGGKTALAIGQWYCLAETWNGFEWQLYVNGQLEMSKPCKAVSGDDQNICIGRTSGPKTPAWFLGDIDDVYIYDKALSSHELLEMYNENRGDDKKVAVRETIKDDTGITVKEYGQVKMWGKLE